MERQQLPQEVHDFFSELFANSDDIAADARKGEKGALDYISLEGHMGQYHDRQSRNEVKKDDALPWFRYVNQAVNDYLVRDDATPIILCLSLIHILPGRHRHRRHREARRRPRHRRFARGRREEDRHAHGRPHTLSLIHI